MLIAFDLDGTLVDSAPDLAHCVDRALESGGFVAAGEALTRGWIGHGIESLVASALEHALGYPADKAVFDSAFDEFRACYERNLFSRSKLYEGVQQTLDRLLAAGHVLCCITNKRAAYSEALLAQACLLEKFSLVFGGDSFARKKPHPHPLLEAARRSGADPRACVMVGDSHHDAQAAQAAGFAFVRADYGYGAGTQTRQDHRSKTIHRFGELQAIITAYESSTSARREDG